MRNLQIVDRIASVSQYNFLEKSFSDSLEVYQYMGEIILLLLDKLKRCLRINREKSSLYYII